jgi:serine/threonine protein kinase
VAIADLGMACRDYDSEEITQKCGSPGYVDPFVLNGHSFCHKSDIFSLGSLLYNLITGMLLFGGTTMKEVLKKNQFLDPTEFI